MAEDADTSGGGASAGPGTLAFEQAVIAKTIDGIEWWDPFARYCLEFRGVCTNCKTKLDPQAQTDNDDANSESEGGRAAGKSGKGACSRCHRAFYCGPECQREHWKSTHKDTCRASVHLNKDLDFFGPIAEVSTDAVYDLQRLAYPGHIIRAEADKKWEKKDWKGAAEAYQRALRLIKGDKEKAETIVEDHGLEPTHQYIAKAQFEQNGCRLKCNLIACHLQLAVPKLEAIVQGPKGPATDGDRLVALVKHFQVGPNMALSALDDIFQDATDAIEEDDGIWCCWWKLYYREAQICHCTLRYKKAMENIGRARDMIENPFGGSALSKDEAVKARKLVDALEVEVKKVINAITGSPTLPSTDGMAQKVLGSYFESGYTPLENTSPNIPIDTCKEEILAVRLLAAADDSVRITRAAATGDGSMAPGVNVNYQHAEQARALLNKILTIVAQPPFLLFPASGSGERAPPISVHLLAFYFRACLSKTGMNKLKIEEFCQEATAWLPDETAYAIATHAFKEVEEAHNPARGHAKELSQTGAGGCMPCACRLVRGSGISSSDWASGLQMAAHNGRIEWTAFALNRLIEGASDKSVYEIILERDGQGCSSCHHAANDMHSRLCDTTLRLLAQAVAFCEPNSEEKRAKVRAILEADDTWGMSPALAAVSLNNTVALAAFADLGARFWDNDGGSKATPGGATRAMKEGVIKYAERSGSTTMQSLVKAIQANTDGRECCAFCGKIPRGGKKPLQACSKCGRAFYCNEDCQSRAYSKHKFVCTTATVEHDEAWFSRNISMPKP